MIGVKLYVVGCLVVGVHSQLGVTQCTLTTQENCPNFLVNSYCNIANSVCECPSVTGYIDDGLGIACTYDCGALAAPASGGVDTSGGTTTGDIAQFSCNNGYQMSGGSTSTCVADTGWDNTATTCVPAVLGDDCSVNIFQCINIPFGTCDFVSCVCQAGYEDNGSGTACTDIDECASSPCHNGGSCVDAVNSYTCTCADGYDGSVCGNNVDECDPDPCLNGATCTYGIDQYTCTCVDGYIGTDCETNNEECSPDPCLNGASCTDEVNDYSCECLPGYSSKTCGINIDDCSSAPCQNGGTCVDGIDDYSCNCVAGYEGPDCENDIDECLGHTCQNGATCVDGVNTYTCVSGLVIFVCYIVKHVHFVTVYE